MNDHLPEHIQSTIEQVTDRLHQCSDESENCGVFMYINAKRGTFEAMFANASDLDVAQMCEAMLEVIHARAESEDEFAEQEIDGALKATLERIFNRGSDLH